jgi:cellulose biosynthesis protein BcsQ
VSSSRWRAVAIAADGGAGPLDVNPGLSIHGIVLTMFDLRNNLSNQVVADVRQFMGSKVYNTMIPAQRAHLRGAVLRQAGAGVRS